MDRRGPEGGSLSTDARTEASIGFPFKKLSCFGRSVLQPAQVAWEGSVLLRMPRRALGRWPAGWMGVQSVLDNR